MSSNSYLAIECLVILLALGLAAFFVKPAYELGVGIIIGAVIATLNAATGAKAGAKMPEQAATAEPSLKP